MEPSSETNFTTTMTPAVDITSCQCFWTLYHLSTSGQALSLSPSTFASRQTQSRVAVPPYLPCARLLLVFWWLSFLSRVVIRRHYSRRSFAQAVVHASEQHQSRLSTVFSRHPTHD